MVHMGHMVQASFPVPRHEQQHIATEGQRLLAQEKLLACHVIQCDCWLMQVFSVCLVVFTIVHIMNIQAKGTERYSMVPVYITCLQHELPAAQRSPHTVLLAGVYISTAKRLLSSWAS